VDNIVEMVDRIKQLSLSRFISREGSNKNLVFPIGGIAHFHVFKVWPAPCSMSISLVCRWFLLAVNGNTDIADNMLRFIKVQV